jgi:beta-aspartyl-peptidase (threonine type)
MDHLSVPFYQAYTNNTCTKARCADLLLGNGEVLGLGQRHILANDILAALEQHEVPAKPYDWYMEIRDTKPALP